MKKELVSRLIDLNHLFYQTFAAPFAATRQRIQPGVQAIMNRMLEAANPLSALLDLGCGNGELARRLIRRGYRGFFHGLDFSEGLLDEARRSLGDSAAGQVRFDVANFAQPEWDVVLGTLTFDAAVAFAVLHHLPGSELRQAVVGKVARHLQPGAIFYISVWQFLNSPRLASRVLPWSSVQIDPAELEPGDTLLDWRAGGQGLRYVHHFDEAELAALGEATGFRVRESYFSDGENGRLGLYQTWEWGTD